MGFFSSITKPFKKVFKEVKRFYGKIEDEIKRHPEAAGAIIGGVTGGAGLVSGVGIGAGAAVGAGGGSLFRKARALGDFSIPPPPRPSSPVPTPRSIGLEEERRLVRSRMKKRRGWLSTIRTQGVKLGTANTVAGKAKRLGHTGV